MIMIELRRYDSIVAEPLRVVAEEISELIPNGMPSTRPGCTVVMRNGNRYDVTDDPAKVAALIEGPGS